MSSSDSNWPPRPSVAERLTETQRQKGQVVRSLFVARQTKRPDDLIHFRFPGGRPPTGRHRRVGGKGLICTPELERYEERRVDKQLVARELEDLDLSQSLRGERALAT